MNRHDPPKSRQAAVFKSNRSQAVRIPKELAFPADVRRVTITPVEGGGLLLEPVSTWADYLVRRQGFSDDFPDEIPDSPPESVPSFD